MRISDWSSDVCSPIWIVQRELSADLSAQVQAFASRLGTTPFTVLFAGFAVLMHRLSGDATVLVGTPATHREQRGTEGLLGILLTNLALRADFELQTGLSALEIGRAHV